jgi:DNA-binding NarL/FixJ family response regulator
MANKKDEITVLIVDDHPLFRQGVVDVLSLSDSIRVIGEASNGEEGLQLIRSLLPDVAIVDINLPGLNGQQVTQQVVQEKLPTRIMLLTAYDDQEQVLHSAWAGAVGYCSKDIEPERLIQAINEISLGNYVLEEQIFNRVEFVEWLEQQMGKARHLYSEPGSPFHPLSLREMEVLSCVVDGKSNKEIANLLGISHQTVKNHVTSILRKFGVEDRTQAVVYALKRGWVQLNDEKMNDIQE